MSRWKAATIHASISAIIGILAALLIFGLWYPPPYARATGAPELVMLLLGVDLTLGPLLTLVVFKTGKKGMAFDLAVIGTLQACALAYGLHVVAAARPVYVVGAVDRFTLVTANEIDHKDLADAAPPFRTLPWLGPRLIGAVMPTDVEGRNDLVFLNLAGKDMEKLPKYYADYAEVAPELLNKAKPLDQVQREHPGSEATFQHWLNAQGRHAADIVALPVIAPRGDLAMLLDAKTGTPLGALPVDLW